MQTTDQFLVYPDRAQLSVTDKAFIKIVKDGKVGTKNQFLIVLGESEILDTLDPEDDSVEVVDEKHGICLITGKRRLKTAKQFYDETYGAAVEQAQILDTEVCAKVTELRTVKRLSLREVARTLKIMYGLTWIDPEDSQVAGLAICRVVAEKEGILFDKHKAWNGI